MVLRIRFNGILWFQLIHFECNIYKDEKLKVENGGRDEYKLYTIKQF